MTTLDAEKENDEMTKRKKIEYVHFGALRA